MVNITFSLLAQLKSCRKHKQTTVDTDVNVETESKKRSRVEPGSFSFTKTCKQFFVLSSWELILNDL